MLNPGPLSLADLVQHEDGPRVADQRAPADAWTRMVDRLAATSAQIEFQQSRTVAEQSLAATHLPIWSSGRRPGFWPDLPVRELLTAAHRQMEINQARALCERTYGPGRTPARSSIHRYWQRLDAMRGRT